MRSLLLPHSGSCRLLPPTPVALTSILDASTRVVDPAILLVHIYMHACCHRSRTNDIIHWMMQAFALLLTPLPELLAQLVLTARRPQWHQYLLHLLEHHCRLWIIQFGQELMEISISEYMYVLLLLYPCFSISIDESSTEEQNVSVFLLVITMRQNST